jgi:hypothetical protein
MADDTSKPADGAQPPRIHVDDDWKRQAQAEKERLAREAEAAAAAPPPRGPSGPAAGAEAGAGQGQPRGGRRMPPATFVSLVQALATQAALFLSDQHDPETGQPMQHLGLAKHNIDLLAVLEEKTKGNLADDEKAMLDRLLYELRMAYVSAAS